MRYQKFSRNVRCGKIKLLLWYLTAWTSLAALKYSIIALLTGIIGKQSKKKKRDILLQIAECSPLVSEHTSPPPPCSTSYLQESQNILPSMNKAGFLTVQKYPWYFFNHSLVSKRSVFFWQSKRKHIPQILTLGTWIFLLYNLAANCLRIRAKCQWRSQWPFA